MKAKTQKKAKKAKVKAKKRTLTQRVARLEKTRREALKIALDAYTSAAACERSARLAREETLGTLTSCRKLVAHVERLLREKQTLLALREVPQELRR